MTLHAMHFQDHLILTRFINLGPAMDPDNPVPILRENILKIDADTTSGGWVIWWWA